MMRTVFLSIGIVIITPFIVLANHGLTPVGFVNDYAALLSPQVKESLETDLDVFEKQTGSEIAVVTIPSLEGESIEEYALTLFEEWNIGKEVQDNGLLLLIAKEDRAIRIEVGYGLEAHITDGRAGRIIRDDITPAFQEGNYDEGVKKGVKSITTFILAGEPEQPQEQVQDTISRVLPWIFDNQFSFFLFIFLLIYAVNYMARTKSIWAGGLFGGGLGAFLGWLFLSGMLGVFLFFALGGFGLLLDYLFSRNYRERKAKGLPVDFWSSRGGFWGGGFGGGSGGGFGGFGGGSSGGGGASGRW